MADNEGPTSDLVEYAMLLRALEEQDENDAQEAAKKISESPPAPTKSVPRLPVIPIVDKPRPSSVDILLGLSSSSSASTSQLTSSKKTPNTIANANAIGPSSTGTARKLPKKTVPSLNLSAPTRKLDDLGFQQGVEFVASISPPSTPSPTMRRSTYRNSLNASSAQSARLSLQIQELELQQEELLAAAASAPTNSNGNGNAAVNETMGTIL